MTAKLDVQIRSMRRSPKPAIAAVEGNAAGAGRSPELASHSELERVSFSDLLHQPQARAGIAAFLDRRTAQFPKQPTEDAT